jgi:hypothetical protein
MNTEFARDDWRCEDAIEKSLVLVGPSQLLILSLDELRQGEDNPVSR